MTSGSDNVAEIVTSSKTKELFGYHCKLQRSLLCLTPLTKMSCDGSNHHCDTRCNERLPCVTLPLFTQRADTTSPLSVSTQGRNAIGTERRLKGKHFPMSRCPERKCCVGCGYKKNSS